MSTMLELLHQVSSKFFCLSPSLLLRLGVQVKPLKPNEDPFSSTQVYVVLVSLGTVVLWCCNSFIKEFTGEMGVLAIIPMVAFFGTGVLSKDDFNGFLWNVVMLAMGGLALGEAVKSSGLLATIAEVGGRIVGTVDVWSVKYTFLTDFIVIVSRAVIHLIVRYHDSAGGRVSPTARILGCPAKPLNSAALKILVRASELP
jgi:di/tricarboxylate transporter